MTEKGTPPLPDPSPTLSPARAGEREKNVAGAKHESAQNSVIRATVRSSLAPCCSTVELRFS